MLYLTYSRGLQFNTVIQLCKFQIYIQIKLGYIEITKACGIFLSEGNFRNRLLPVLKSEGFEFFEGENFSEDQLLNEVLKQEFSVLVIDIDSYSIIKILIELNSCLSSKPYIICLSENKMQAYDCIKMQANDYLLKSESEFEIRKSFKRFKKDNGINNTNICFKNYSDYYFLQPDEILYLKADNNTTDITMISGKTIPAFKKLKTFENNLPDYFLRIHNSYIINSKKISRINFGKSQVYLTEEDEQTSIPFSRTYKQKLKRLRNFLNEQDIVF